jgi:nucleoside-diphosphate kinase
MNTKDTQTERTLSILKPDITKRNLTGEVNTMLESAGFRIVAQKKVKLTLSQAREFYAVHKEKPFYDDLCEFLSSAPVVVQVLEKGNAISDYRELMGATNPVSAAEGTIRSRFGISVDQNSVHGSDSPETAAEEIKFFFSEIEITG